MQQQRLSKCNVIMHVVPIRATTPFANALIRLDRLQSPSLKNQQSYNSLRLRNNRATTPFANNAYAMTQHKMQQQQHHINILNQPQKIFTSTQDYWKDNTIINNFRVYTKVQLKTETCVKDTRTRKQAVCQ